ncbi:MAG: hypothetical protein WD336_09355 [Trueperaceae bacterium]
MITVRKLAVGLAAVLFATFASAQEANGDDVLERYRLAIESLQQANVAIADDAVAARTELDRAFSALLTLSRGGSAPLASSLDRVFERARTAIENRSATDLAVQTGVLRGGFQRMLYEAALASAVEGRDAQAAARLQVLANDVNLGAARLEQLQQAEDVRQMRRTFEAGVAERIEARLAALVEAAPPANVDVAYRSLSGAYADFLLIQDSGRLDPAAQGRFVAAAEALVAGDGDAYAAALSTAVDQMTALRTAADEGAEALPATDAGVPAPAPEADPATDPVADDPASDDPAAEAAAEAAEPAEAPDAAAVEGADPDATLLPTLNADDSEATANLIDALQDGSVTLPMLRARLADDLADARTAEEREALASELRTIGLPATAADTLAADLHGDGVLSVTELERDLAARVTRLEAEVQRGRPAQVDVELGRMVQAYDAGLGRIVPRTAPDDHLAFQELLTRISDSPTVRSQEVALLAGAVSGLSDRLRTRDAGVLHGLSDTVHDLWSGWIRAAVMIALGVLALLPLRLLRTAFGAGNRNWRLVGNALTLLLLPVFIEALISAAALLAEPLSMPILAAGTVASIFTSELTQFVWAVVMLLAILLATFGFYGICVQFGVLGSRGRKAPAQAAPAKQPTRDETLVDWDDDY